MILQVGSDQVIYIRDGPTLFTEIWPVRFGEAWHDAPRSDSWFSLTLSLHMSLQTDDQTCNIDTYLGLQFQIRAILWIIEQ